MILHVATDGTITCLYDELIDLAAIGELDIGRASRVDPDNHGQWWVRFCVPPLDAIGLRGDGELGPYPRRSEALAVEREHIEEFLQRLGNPLGSGGA
jgi:hypothetical protein